MSGDPPSGPEEVARAASNLGVSPGELVRLAREGPPAGAPVEGPLYRTLTQTDRAPGILSRHRNLSRNFDASAPRWSVAGFFIAGAATPLDREVTRPFKFP
jgi:hypothetical protein